MKKNLCWLIAVSAMCSQVPSPAIAGGEQLVASWPFHHEEKEDKKKEDKKVVRPAPPATKTPAADASKAKSSTDSTTSTTSTSSPAVPAKAPADSSQDSPQNSPSTPPESTSVPVNSPTDNSTSPPQTGNSAPATPQSSAPEPTSQQEAPPGSSAQPEGASKPTADPKSPAAATTTPPPKAAKPAQLPKRPPGMYAISPPEEPSTLNAGTNIVLQGIPKPPLSLVDDINRYTEFRKATVSDWHPTKKWMIIETRFGDTSQVHLLENPGGDREQLTFFRDACHGATFPPGKSELIIFNKDKGGDEFYQKFSYRLSNKKVDLLTDGQSRNTGGVWSTAGTRLAYGSTRRNGKDVDIFLVDPPSRTSTRALCELSGGGWTPLDWSPDDKAILLQEEISINESRLWIVDTKFGAKTMVAPAEASEKVYYGDAKFSKDGKGIYTITDKDSEFQKLTYIDLTTKKHSCLSESINWDILEFDLSLDGTKIAFVANEDGLCKLHVLDTTTNQTISLPDLPKGQVSGLHWHRNNQDLAFNIENAKTPSDVYSLNIETLVIDRWTKSETGMIDLGNASSPQLVHWPSFDEKQISGFLYQPSKSFIGKRPVLINIHGGPESQWRPRFLGATNYLLNELGIAIIYPNVRGSMGYGKTFSQMDNGLQRSDSYKDIGALIEWIKTNPALDANKIMVMGGSYGGNMTLACAMLYNENIKCSLDAFGPSNFVTFLKNTQPYRQDLRRVEYGDERDPKVAAYLEDIAPLNHAETIKKPLFVVQGDNDPRVPVSESDQMVKAVRAAGTPVWYLRAKDEGHGFNKKVNVDYLFFTMVEFIKQYLLD